MDLQKVCENVVIAARKAGKFMLEEQSRFSIEKVEKKGMHDYVSYVDKGAEEIIISEIRNLIPDAGYITEEATVDREKKEYTWIIDPLDGTTNYIHGMNPYSVSIGLIHNNIPVLGVVYMPFGDECFYAWKDSPAYLNGVEISVSAAHTIEDSLIITGFPYKLGSKVENYLDLIRHLTFGSHGIRRLGSAAIDLVYVACGRADAFFQTDLQPWDVAAGIVIAQQAGAKLSDFRSGDNYLFGKSILACTPAIHTEFIDLFTKFFPEQE